MRFSIKVMGSAGQSIGCERQFQTAGALTSKPSAAIKAGVLREDGKLMPWSGCATETSHAPTTAADQVSLPKERA